MLANASTVRDRCVTVVSTISDTTIQTEASMVDALLDAQLRTVFHWPISPSGEDLESNPPALVREIANLLVSAAVVARMTALSEQGNPVVHPYSGRLRRMGETMLNDLIGGQIREPALVRRTEVGVSSPPKTFELQRNLPGTRGRPWR